LACTFFHGEATPRSLIPFEVDGVRFIVEKCDKGGEFREGCSYHVLEFFTGDAIELVCQVEEDRSSCGEGVGAFRLIDKLLDGQLHGFDYEVRAVGNPNGKVIWEEVCGKFIVKCACDVGHDEASDGSGDAQGLELGRV